jgi:A/G-specific adenine glycosylase
MELGALICTPKNPDCSRCPLIPFCIAHRDDLIGQRPIPKRSAKQMTIEMATGILPHPFDTGLVFIQQRLADDVWGGLWEFPGGRLKPEEQPEQAVIREFWEETGYTVRPDRKITTTIHFYTRYKVILHCFLCALDFSAPEEPPSPVLTAAQQYRWVSLAELDAFAFPAGHRKLIEFIKHHPVSQL